MSSQCGEKVLLDRHNETPEDQSARILASWLERSGLKRSHVVRQLNMYLDGEAAITPKMFNNWVSGQSMISGKTPEITGERIRWIAKWLLAHGDSEDTITPQELEQYIEIYSDIPVRSRLQLKAILHELERRNGQQRLSLYISGDWKQQFSQLIGFRFVYDAFWCIRATSKYCMELVGLQEDDMGRWDYWHRMTSRIGSSIKLESQHPLSNIRGVYREEYHRNQMLRFKRDIEGQRYLSKERYDALLSLLIRNPQFEERWDGIADVDPNVLTQTPVPFFRPDETFCLLLEMSMPMAETENYFLAAWIPTNSDTSEYLALIQREVDESSKYSSDVFFIEDYKHFFTEQEKLVLGLKDE